MHKYSYNPKPERSVKVFGRGVRVSKKNAAVLCKEVTGSQLDKGKQFLAGLLSKKSSIGGKYYTNTAKTMSELIDSAASNAEFKGLDPIKLHIHASAHKGFSFRRPRRFKMRGERRKLSNIQIVLEER